MTRFNTTQEVQEWAAIAAAGDYKRHVENGIDLNPYCTDGARNYWQRGYDNKPAHSWEHSLEWDTQYQRGKAAAAIVQSLK